MNFLNHESDLLDKNKLDEWFELLTDDITYQIPVRTTRGRLEEQEFSEASFFMKEDYESLQSRIHRLKTEYDWSENPPSRSRRYVTNIKIDRIDGDELFIRSNLLLYRTRGDKTSYDLISCEREDTLRRVDTELKLAKRRVLLDQTVLGLESGRSLTVFL
jgi:3-phenylpropionate/cinnamic acid dioxygenase small subunit